MPVTLENSKGRPPKTDGRPNNCARKLRLLTGFSLEWVAEAIGCTFQHLSYAERFGKRFGIRSWMALAKFYGVSVEDLFNPDFKPGKKFAEKFKITLD